MSKCLSHGKNVLSSALSNQHVRLGHTSITYTATHPTGYGACHRRDVIGNTQDPKYHMVGFQDLDCLTNNRLFRNTKYKSIFEALKIHSKYRPNIGPVIDSIIRFIINT